MRRVIDISFEKRRIGGQIIKLYQLFKTIKFLVRNLVYI